MTKDRQKLVYQLRRTTLETYKFLAVSCLEFLELSTVTTELWRLETLPHSCTDWLNSVITLISKTLLSKNESSYNVCIEQGDWGSLSPEKESIVALKPTYENGIKGLRLKLKTAQSKKSRKSRVGSGG